MNIKEWKIELRKRAEAGRNAITPEDREQKSKRISERLFRRLTEVLDSRARMGRRPTLFTYMPFKSEVDVRAVMEACWTNDYRIVVPKVQPEQKLRLHEVRSYDDLETGKWDIEEPRDDAPVLADIRQIDAILVPGLAFDVKLGRLGYGGGYYDRFMQQYVRAGLPKPYAIAGAFELQMIEEVPMGMFDFRLDELITEVRTIRARRG